MADQPLCVATLENTRMVRGRGNRWATARLEWLRLKPHERAHATRRACHVGRDIHWRGAVSDRLGYYSTHPSPLAGDWGRRHRAPHPAGDTARACVGIYRWP